MPECNKFLTAAIKPLCIIPQAPLYTTAIRKLCIIELYTIAGKTKAVAKKARKVKTQNIFCASFVPFLILD